MRVRPGKGLNLVRTNDVVRERRVSFRKFLPSVPARPRVASSISEFLHLAKGSLFGLASIAALAGCSGPATRVDPKPAVAAAMTGKEPEIAPNPNSLRLVSQAQYVATIQSLFGSDVTPNVTFPPFQRTEGLIGTGAAYEDVTDDRVELYQRAASIVADLVVSPQRRDFLIPCRPANEKGADAACAAKFFRYIGERLFRHPLTPAKLAEIVAAAGQGADRLHDFYAGMSLALEGVLLSPKALYIEEIAEPDPNHPGHDRLEAYSIASRLSYFLWNQAPDDALLAAAARGDLYSPKGRAKTVDAMLMNPKLEGGVRAFFDDMFGFDNFQTLAKDPTVYPAFTGAAVADAREQTLHLLVDHLITHKGDYRDLFTTRSTFISKSLAPLYHEPTVMGWADYQAPTNSLRVGLLTQVSFLALYSHPGRSSPTLRGKALRELILCQPVPRPPANVDFSAVENPDPKLHTARDRLELHRKNPVCAGCHKITDPIGLALENFDGAGQYRPTEKGSPIDASGSLDGRDFKDAVGLGQALHDHPAVPACLVKRLYSYAIGRRLSNDDQPLLDYFDQRFADGAYQLPNLMRTIALSDAFLEVRKSDDKSTPPPSEKTASALASVKNAQ